MIKYEDECVGCSGLGLPCLGSTCPNRRVPHLYCDVCGEEVETLYEYDGQQCCKDCVINDLTEVTIY